MEKDQITEPTETQEDENIIDSTEIENTSEQQEPVIVKKSGNGLALFLALLALGLSAYLFYQQWQQKGLLTQADNSADSLKQIQDKNAQIENNIKNLQQQVDALKKADNEIRQSLSSMNSQLANQNNNETQNTEFDNTDNEVAIQRIQTQLASQAQLLATIQSQLAAPANIQTVGDLPQNNFDALHNTRIIQTLTMAQTMLDTNQITPAISTLENLQQSAPAGFDHHNQLQNIINAIKQIRQPDLTTLKQRVTTVSAEIQNLQLPVAKNTEEAESKWYENFISVKKIDSNQGLDSTLDLLSMKSQLSHLLQSAQFSLNLSVENAWQQSLTEASDLLKSKLPEQQNLIRELQQLAAEPIKATVPKNLGIMTLVNDLKESY